MWRRLLVLPLLCTLGAARGTLDGLADALVERARPELQPARDLDVAVQVRGAWARLGDDLTALLCTRLRSLGVRSVARADGEAAAARAAGFERLLRLDVDVAGGKLRVSGTLVALSASPWRDEPQGEARAHLYAEAPLDAELRAYAPAIAAPPSPWQARGVPIGDLDVLALDVGDVDGDGRAELAAATAAELIVWSWEGAHFVERGRWPLGGALAAQRPRSDVATVSIDSGVITAHASPFAAAVRRAGHTQTAVHGYSFAGLVGACELEPGVDWFSASSCPSASGLPERFWIAAGLRSGARAVKAAIDPSGTLTVLAGAPPSLSAQSARGVGAQLTLAALDRGELVVTSEPVQPGEPDAIVLRALGPGLPIIHRVDRLPGQVHALAAGDVDGDGRVEIVAAVRDAAARRTELWLIQ